MDTDTDTDHIGTDMDHMDSMDTDMNHMDSIGTDMDHMDSIGTDMDHMDSIGTDMDNMDSIGTDEDADEDTDENAALQEWLGRSNARFMVSMSRILERYNHPFENDFLVSMETLTYDTPDGPRKWGKVPNKNVKKWKKELLEHNRGSQRNAEISKQQISDFEGGDSSAHQESSENSYVDTSDTDETSDVKIVSERRKFEDVHLQKLEVSDGRIQAKRKVRVDVIVQEDARNIPKWIEMPKINDRKIEGKVPVDVIVQDDDRDIPKWIEKPEVNDGRIQAKQKVRVDVIAQEDARNIPKWIEMPKVNDRQIEAKGKVPVDVIVQGDDRDIPKWIEVTHQGLSGLCLTSPVQELIGATKSFDGNQTAVCRKKLELSNECSSSRSLHLQCSVVPIPSNTITIPRHRPSPEWNRTRCDSIFEEHQSAREGYSRSNITLADLYPAMVELLTRLITTESRRKALQYMFGRSRFKRYHSRRPKLNVTVDKIRGFRPFKLKKAQHSICSSGNGGNQNPICGNESREFCYDNCLISSSSALVSYTDRNEFRMDDSDSSSEHHLGSGKGQNVSKQNAFPNVTTRMGETFLVEDEVQTTASLKSSECKEREKLSYRCLSGYHFVTPTASSELTVLHLVKENKTQKTDTTCGTSQLCSLSCYSYGNNDTFVPVSSYSSVQASNTLLINPEKIISERQNSFQPEHSFSSLFMKQSPSKIPQKYEDAFEELYFKVCSEEFQKPLILARCLSNSQNLEEKGRLVKRSDFLRSSTHIDREFDRIYDQLRGEAVPKPPWFQRVSNLRKYEGIKMSETVKAIVNSPVQTSSAIARVKRLGNFQHDLLCSPVKRLKPIPEPYFSPTKCQEISHRKSPNLQTVGKDFLSTHKGSKPSFFEDHNCQIQYSGFHDSSFKTSLAVPGTSLQETGIADAHSGWPRAMENCNSPRNTQKCHPRVYRKLSYTDGENQNLDNHCDTFLCKTHQGAFTDC